MKTRILTIVLLFCSQVGYTASQTVDGVAWYYTIENGCAIVGSGTTKTIAIPSATTGKVVVPEKLGGCQVTRIADYAFWKCTNLTEISIPEGVTHIGKAAFLVCSALTVASIPNSVSYIGDNAFSQCALSEITLPEGFETIEEQTFCSTLTLKRVMLPKSLKVIKKNAFWKTGLLKIDVPEGVTTIEEGAFQHCEQLVEARIPNSVASIGYLFAGCYSLRSVEIPESVTSLRSFLYSYVSNDARETTRLYQVVTNVAFAEGTTTIAKNLFYGCIGLKKVLIPPSVTEIASDAFAGISSISCVTMPSTFKVSSVFPSSYASITSINIPPECEIVCENAYDGCSSLTEIMLPTNLRTVKKCAFRNCINLESVDIPEQVTVIPEEAFSGCLKLSNVVIPEGLQEIESGAFKSCQKLTNIAIPSGVSKIGDSCFSGCASLERIVLPSILTTVPKCGFESCSELIEVVIPEGVEEIEDSAFDGCKSLTAVRLPQGLKRIGVGAFRGCTALTEIEIPDSVTDLGDNVFYGCTALKRVKLSKALTAIGSGAFRGCSSLEEINLPASLQSIGADAYYGCSNVIELNIPDGVTSIGNTAFKDCTELRKVSIPDSVTTIGSSAFAGCANVWTVSMPTRFRMSTIFPSSYTAITAATMPEGTTKVADNAYYGCAALTSVTLPSCVTAIGNNAFRGCAALTSVTFPAGLLTIGEYAYYGCSGLSSVEIPQSVTQIGANAFGGCNGLTSVTVPECVTSIKTTFPNAYQQITSVGLTRTCKSIPSGMFSGCAALASITFPPGISSIGASAFSGCVGISEVVIPASVKEIGENAFLNCTSLEAVSIPSSVEVLGATAFKGCAAIKTVVLERADKPLKELFPDAYRTIEDLTVNELTIEASDFFDGCESLVDVDVPEDCELYSWTFKEPRFDGDWWIENGWVLGYSGETGTSFVLPDELTKFGGGAFDGNAEIEEVTLGKETEVAGGFSNCPELQIVNFGGNERRIGAYAFGGDTYLDNVTIPASVEEIGKEAFLNCSYIQDLAFEGGVRDIGAGAFSNCASLISLELKDGGKRIGENAFYGCWRLMSVRLPLSLEQIGNNAFKGLKNLTGVTVPTHVKTMKEIFPDRYSSITSVVIPEGETDIIDGMFEGCSALTSIVIPNSVTNVGARAFGGCSSLVELGLSDGVRRIGASALTGCSKIRDFTLPKNLESVGDAAFSSCSLLTTMVIPETVTQIGAGIVPYSLRSLYFLGNAPVCVGNPLNGTYSGLTVYVIRGTKGWDGVATSRVLPETWNGRTITSWTPNQFGVVFDANGGEPATYTVQEITDNSYAFPKAVPTMTGYDFAGWWTEREGGAEVKTYTKVTATKSHTLYAHWELRDDVVIVNFNANGGTITPMSKVYVVGYPFVDLPVPTRRGYRFAGWRSETGAAVSEKTIATAQMSTLVASWTANGYTVVYHSNDGEDAQVSQSFAYGVEATLRRNTFTRKDHAFVGWATVADGDKVYDDADAVVNLAEVDGSVIHLYAVWIRTVVNYAVRFDGNGGGGSMDNENFTEGEVKCLTANAFVRAGFVFVGWSLTPDGEVAYEDGEEVSNLPFGTDHTLSLYAVWIAEDEFVVSKPVVNVPPDGTFETETFLVTLSCATKGADIYYSTNGRTPRVSEQSRYSQPFEVADTTTIIAVAVRYGKLSAYTEVTVTKVDPVVLTLETSLDEPKLKGVTTGGDGNWTAVREEFARVGGACARSGSVGADQRTWLEATVSGKGELTFYWRVSCEHDGRGLYSYDHLVFTAKDAHKEFKIDGVTDWIQQKVTFDTEGEHTLRWEYVTDDWEEPGFADCGWVDGVVWTPSAAPTVGPTIEGDEGATVMGDAETGFVVKPSEGKTAVEVSIPDGIDAGRITVELSAKVESVKPNGAKVRIVSDGADITGYLDIPGTVVCDDGGVVATQSDGVIDLTKATVKEEFVKEAMDVEKGAVIDLSDGPLGTTGPVITTAPTRVGLFYQFREGETLGGMKDGDSTIGNGKPWKPEIKVKGGNSAFYSIGVGKGEQ